MLRLERMEIRGFKSFRDRTEVQFRPGITAIVGPNGCGKSNIGDALNWVLGEQSAKMLRGQQMADVIFNGSELRRPLGMAEVSLVFQGAEGPSADEQGRVTITRRLFRSGESEYELNGVRSRLRDIQELLREGKVGARTYATIEQGKVDQVLNAKPKDRRALIEDAAGISGYKHKRRLAELKLEATQANLLRVQDIVSEVQRQIGSLKRQAARARRYRRLREDLRAKELQRFSLQARELDAELSRVRREEEEARDFEAGKAAGVARLEAQLAECRESLETANRSFREATERLHEIEIEIDRAEAQANASRERIAEASEQAAQREAEADGLSSRYDELADRLELQRATLEGARSELERLSLEVGREQAALETAERSQRDLREEIERQRGAQFEAMTRAADERNTLRACEEALERLGTRRARLEADRLEVQDDFARHRISADEQAEAAESHRRELSRKRQELEDVEQRLRAARERLQEDLAALVAAREGEKAALAHLATLQDVATRFAGVSDGVRSLLTEGSRSGIRNHGVMADYIEASREVESAAEGYLQALLPTVILEDDSDASRAAVFLRAAGAGRTSLVCKSHPAGAPAVGTGPNGHGAVPPEILADRRVLGRLRDRLTLRSSANGVVADRVGDALLVDTLESALALHRRFPAVDYLSSDGDVVYASGIVSAGGQPRGDQGLLAHRRKTHEAEIESANASTRTAQREQPVEAGKREIERAEAEMLSRRRELEESERRNVEIELRMQRSHEQTAESGRRSEVLEEELQAITAEIAAQEDLLGRSRIGTDRAAEACRELEYSLGQRWSLSERNEGELRQRLEQATELRAEQAAKRQRLQALEQESRRLEEDGLELESRLESLRLEVDSLQAKAESGRELLARMELELVDLLQRRAELGGSARDLEHEIAAAQEERSRLEGELRGERGQLESCRETTRAVELSRAKAEAARTHLDDLCRQELGIAAGEALSSGTPLPDDADPAALAEEVERLKQRIEEIGPVNMTAIDEFSELEARHTFLTTQRKDLDESMESLRETIRRINRQSRTHFAEAFEQIRVYYQEVYRSLFHGGRADLRLEEGEDVLECGIEILAQPPGKRLTGVHLLSGGEKALSAIALLFAVFRYQPSPFCLLDEVDAPLDDSNVVRFARMVAEYAKNTQFVIVTHNKLSMEAADCIYGVTMEEPGVSKVMSLQLA